VKDFRNPQFLLDAAVRIKGNCSESGNKRSGVLRLVSVINYC